MNSRWTASAPFSCHGFVIPALGLEGIQLDDRSVSRLVGQTRLPMKKLQELNGRPQSVMSRNLWQQDARSSLGFDQQPVPAQDDRLRLDREQWRESIDPDCQSSELLCSHRGESRIANRGGNCLPDHRINQRSHWLTLASASTELTGLETAQGDEHSAELR
jgi:hypothetical protein